MRTITDLITQGPAVIAAVLDLTDALTDRLNADPGPLAGTLPCSPEMHRPVLWWLTDYSRRHRRYASLRVEATQICYEFGPEEERV